MKLGSHISFKKPGYLATAAKESIENGANTMMIYLGAPQSSRRVSVSEYCLEEYMEKYSHIIPASDIVIHAPYITNPANPEKKDFANDLLIKDIERMNFIGAKYMVLHPGAHTKFDREVSIKTLINSLKYIFSKTNDVFIAIETMAGKGTELGTTFEEMSRIVKEVDNPRLKVCLDTCHVWDAGYDITSLKQLLEALKRTELLDLVDVIHVNDSKNILGASKDRHENIGKGYIGLKALKRIVNAPEFKNALMILETPWIDGKTPYKEEIKLLK
ncbi:MAG: deoxyribonuclease IV [Mycoplasmataceae bacterium]|nr:deoxyribonuclease IV [Mycoplasmataceae bacterium]